MDEPIEEVYFNWLYHQVFGRKTRTPSTGYQSLFFVLHSTEYIWQMSGDDNRAEDGKDLRVEFIRQAPAFDEDPWDGVTCSILEMLIAFSRQTAFQTGKDPREWFWIFLENLELAHINDASYEENAHLIGPRLDTFIWRTYDPDGHGGLFPLRYSQNDQRDVEVWYQFCEYVVDQDIE